MIELTKHDVFLTGGTGFVGHHVRRELADRDCQVTLLVREGKSVELRPNERTVVGDVTDFDNLPEIDADFVVHLAAVTNVEQSIENPREVWKVNATGTLNVLELARESSLEGFLYTSTASVYGDPDYVPIDEDHPLNPQEPYGASKLAGERLAMSYETTYGVPVTTVRIFNAFGAGQPTYNVVPTIVSQAITSDEIVLGNLSPSRDFIYIEDAVSGLIAALERGNPGDVYNIGRGEDVTIGRLAELVSSLCEFEGPIRSSTERERDDNVEIPKHVADIERIRSLGWSPSWTIEDGLERVIRYHHEQTDSAG